MLHFKGYLHFNPSDGKNNLSEGFFTSCLSHSPKDEFQIVVTNSTRKRHAPTSSLSWLLVINDLFSLPIPPLSPCPWPPRCLLGHICFIFPLHQNNYYSYCSTPQFAIPFIFFAERLARAQITGYQDLLRPKAGTHWICALSWPAAPSTAGYWGELSFCYSQPPPISLWVFIKES